MKPGDLGRQKARVPSQGKQDSNFGGCNEEFRKQNKDLCLAKLYIAVLSVTFTVSLPRAY